MHYVYILRSEVEPDRHYDLLALNGFPLGAGMKARLGLKIGKQISVRSWQIHPIDDDELRSETTFV